MATLTTGSDGTATSEPLYLGRYQISERTAPAGMVLDPEPKEVTLAYAGQEVSVTTADVGFVNERQKVEISLKKLLEQDETFSIGMNEEWKNITFGLFAAEEIVAADGSSITADGLIETTGTVSYTHLRRILREELQAVPSQPVQQPEETIPPERLGFLNTLMDDG